MKYPKYVMMGGRTALRLVGDTYYRDGGDWYVYFTVRDGKLFSVSPFGDEYPQLHDVQLVECTREEWKEDNGNYAPDNK